MQLQDTREVTVRGYVFRVGTLDGHQVVVGRSGAGKVNAAIITTLLINQFNPSAIFFSGTAGAIDQSLYPGDVVIGITTSGKSPNVLRALDDAQAKGALRIGFSGSRGGVLAEHTDLCFLAPANDTPRIQELHILAWHSICEIVEAALVGGSAVV